MNKRRTLIIALTTALLTSSIMTTTNRSEFTTPEAEIGIQMSSPTEEVKEPLTAILPSKEIDKSNIVEEKKWIDIRVSYYTISKKDTGKLDGITASGKSLKPLSRGSNLEIKYIATPKSIPFGTKLYVEGVGKCEAVDTGSAIQWHGDTMWIDVFVPHATEKELKELGVKYTKGYIIE